MRAFNLAALPILMLAASACNAQSEAGGTARSVGAGERPFKVEPVATFDEPWAMTFLPGGHALISEKAGRLKLLPPGGGTPIEVAGVPKVDYGGQGGLGDVVLHPEFSENNLVYLSWAEAGEGNTHGAVVGRAKLVRDGGSARLDGLQTIWRQSPKVEGQGHYSHRIAFGPDRKLYITSGERQKFTPAQDMNQNLGKVIRLNDDGSVPADNPFAARGGVAAQVWSLGHRNLLGIAFDGQGQLWTNEMGPKGGDELNRIERGSNYGYPLVSNGDHYDGKPIPDHDTRPDLNAPEVWWTPVISPSSLIFYSGAKFPAWRGSALIGGLSSEALIRVSFDGTSAREAERFPMGKRIREVEQGADGSVYLLEDGEGGRLLRLVPAA
ncbi:PQQ-dependent sugar dehydrogenase [Sphingosinicella sp. BN140058]|uniref:PQQ-dependent sugar dehydrogenase n=1 Tax=Sphingosinicella sp. BN140058 TaxID=1892855 RepID=UPI0010122BB7|nr:PQQ-dependent sugar dehydrogenase [Sphingosinicella sp. BN140058]QAY76787.1 PQQ-dependent sugar dehydrogenase [Sphingosinicella sp. BN140058]